MGLLSILRLRAPSILLTHYGYYSATPRPWGTYYDDNFMQDPRFYSRHIGDPGVVEG